MTIAITKISFSGPLFQAPLQHTSSFRYVKRVNHVVLTINEEEAL